MSEYRVLIDTGAIYAFVTRTDEHHKEAVDYVKRLLKRGGVFVLADIVFGETMTLLKARVGSGVAIRVGRELRRNPVYLWVALGPSGERDTWAIFQQYEDKEWSYTDCAILTLSKQLQVGRVLSFDHHFAQMPGVTRVP
jgi:predicted nucleic acid-binding protein